MQEKYEKGMNQEVWSDEQTFPNEMMVKNTTVNTLKLYLFFSGE